jgi:hypothetical protein
MMAKWPKSTTIVLTADALVTSHPCWLHAVFLNASAAGGDVAVYEGQDAGSGRQILHQDGAANATNYVQFTPPVWCQRGLYVDVGSNVSQVTIHYTPQSLNQPEGE